MIWCSQGYPQTWYEAEDDHEPLISLPLPHRSEPTMPGLRSAGDGMQSFKLIPSTEGILSIAASSVAVVECNLDHPQEN